MEVFFFCTDIFPDSYVKKKKSPKLDQHNELQKHKNIDDV